MVIANLSSKGHGECWLSSYSTLLQRPKLSSREEHPGSAQAALSFPVPGPADRPGSAAASNMSAIDDEPKGEPEVELAGASELRLICAEYVLGLFPDICPDYLSRVSTERGHDYEAVVTHILDQSEDGQSYPKRQRVNLKRKRGDEIHEGEDDPAVAAALRFDSDDQRSKLKETEYIKMSKQLLQQAFPLLLVRNLYAEFADQGNCLFPTIRALDKKLQDPQAAGPPLEFKKKGVKLLPEYEAEHLDNTIRNTEDEWAKQALEEFKLARLVGDTYQDKKDEERQRAEAEAENLRLAVLEGTAQDCQCCFAECALNRMVHCDGETFHVTPALPRPFLVSRLTSGASGSVVTVRVGQRKPRSASPSTSWSACIRTSARPASTGTNGASSSMPKCKPPWRG